MIKVKNAIDAYVSGAEKVDKFTIPWWVWPVGAGSLLYIFYPEVKKLFGMEEKEDARNQ